MLCAALFAPAAYAHAPLPGIEGFYRGLAQPFTEPAQGLSLVAIGALIGRTDAKWVLRAFMAVLTTALGALVLAGLTVGEPIAVLPNILLVVALICGGVLALWRTPSGASIVGLAVLAGLATGANALPEAGDGMLITSAGSLVGLAVVLAYAAGAAAWLKRKEVDQPLLQIAIRVAGSWIAAIAILLLAFALRGSPPASETAYCTTQPPSICKSAPLI